MKTRCLAAVFLAVLLGVPATASARNPRAHRRTHRHDKDGARAGKILTGYVVLRTRLDPSRWKNSCPYACRHPGAWRKPCSSIYTENGYVPSCCVVRYSIPAPRRRARRPPPGDPPERWDSQPTGGLEPEGVRELTIPLPDGRRLYQPSGGGPSYVQKWSKEENRWISVAEMPPLR